MRTIYLLFPALCLAFAGCHPADIVNPVPGPPGQGDDIDGPQTEIPVPDGMNLAGTVVDIDGNGISGVVVTDGLQQYHLAEKEVEGFTNANCWTHARRFFADAVKAMGKNDAAVRRSTAFQALTRIAAIYKLEEALKDLSPEERLKERQKNIRSLVEEYFAWVKSTLHDGTVLPRGKTADGLNYSVNQEKYLRVFLTDGNVPIDNSASERAVKPFVLGKKNWMFINTVRGAHASAITYSITETAKANGLNPFYYLEHIFSVMKDYVTLDENRKPDFSMLPKSVIDELLPWSPSLPEKCQKPRR